MSKNVCAAVGAVVAFGVVTMTFMLSSETTGPSYSGQSKPSHMDVSANMAAPKDLPDQQWTSAKPALGMDVRALRR